MIDRNPRILPESELVICDWSMPILGEVVTLSEACVMWGKSKNALKNAALTQKVAARKSFTGGDWLVSVESMVKVYGQPVVFEDEKDILSWLKNR